MTSPDLDWDHSVGEHLLVTTDDDDVSLLDDGENGLTFYNGSILNDSRSEDQDHIKISRRHLSFLLRSLDEASSLLREQQNLQDAARHRHNNNNTRSISRPGDTPVQRSRAKNCLMRMLRYVAKYNLVITILLQALMLILLTIIDMTVGTHCNNCTTGGFVVEEHKGDPATCVVMIIITVINLAVIIYISVRVYKTFIMSRITAIMLAQSYLSTVIMFAALYVITYRIDRKGWTLSSFAADKDDELIVVSYLYLKMLFHSISTSTLAGASTVYPDKWYNYLMMAFQMLMSFLYFTCILRVSTDNTPYSSQPKRHPPSTVRMRRHSLTSLNSRLSLNDRTPRVNGDVGADPARYGGL